MRAVTHLSNVGRDYPGVWQFYDRCLADRDGLGGWPEWCHCPMAAAYAVVSQGKFATPDQAADMPRVAALAAWRPTQGVYRFHPATLAALLETPLTGDLPVEHLQRLPEWCVYIELGLGDWHGDWHGFFAHLEYDAKTRRSELRLLLDTDKRLLPLVLHVSEGTVAAAVDGAIAEAGLQAHARGAVLPMPADAIDSATAIASRLVSVLLYLCAGDPELRATRGSKRGRGRPALKDGRNGPYMPAATRPEVWETGFALGAALAEATASEATGGTVRGHIRRAHWHSFWVGTGDTRRLDLRWLPPIAVNLDAATGPTVRRVDE